MAKRKKKLHAKDVLEFFHQVMVEQHLIPFLIALGLFVWFVERLVVPFSNWVPLTAAVWATIQCTNFRKNGLLPWKLVGRSVYTIDLRMACIAIFPGVQCIASYQPGTSNWINDLLE